jgi:hypothetical protein
MAPWSPDWTLDALVRPGGISNVCDGPDSDVRSQSSLRACGVGQRRTDGVGSNGANDPRAFADTGAALMPVPTAHVGVWNVIAPDIAIAVPFMRHI